MKSNFYTEDELQELGLKSFSKNVLISRKCSIYGAQNIEIGNNVRIDDFCILSGHITIGNYIHISAGAMLFAGDAGIELHDFSGISSRCAVYAISDDYSGIALTNPTVPEQYRKIQSGKVVLEKHSLVGSGSTILPGVTIREGTAIGAMSLITKSTETWKIYCGIPAKILKGRKKNLLELEEKFSQSFLHEF